MQAVSIIEVTKELKINIQGFLATFSLPPEKKETEKELKILLDKVGQKQTEC